jgi:hypothetical protein
VAQTVGPFIFLDHMGPATFATGTTQDSPPIRSQDRWIHCLESHINGLIHCCRPSTEILCDCVLRSTDR